jgi:ArsR family transcriptional regulator
MKFNQQLTDEVHNLHAQVCGGLADPVRILILYVLAEESRSVGDIVNILGLTQPTVSRHLQVLRNRNLVTATREGVNVYYSLADKRIIEALDLLRAVMSDQLNRQVNIINRVP